MKSHFYITAVIILISGKLNCQVFNSKQNDSIFTLSYQNISLEVNACNGAKISSITYNNSEYLIRPNDSNSIIWGSTLWYAPQKEWGWPPPLKLDNGKYKIKIYGDTIFCQSPIELETQFRKKYWVNTSDTSIMVEYKMEYNGVEPVSRALWEVSRVPSNGIAFWIKGEGGEWGALSSWVTQESNVNWLDLSKVTGPKKKLFADTGEGWLAHINNGGLLMLRTFENVYPKDFAKGESEIEIYMDGDLTELENLSKSFTINLGDSIMYATKWYFKHLPNNVKIECGNSELINIVNKMLVK